MPTENADAGRPGLLLLTPPSAAELTGAWSARFREAGWAVRVERPEPDAPDAEAVSLLDAAAAELAGEGGVDPERIAAVGFGEAGTRALLLACTRERLGALVLVQAPVLRAALSAARPFQPVEMVLNLTAALAAHYAGDDAELAEHRTALEAALAQGAKTFELVVHAGAGPTFFDPADSGYHEPSAAAALEGALRFLDENLEPA